MYATSSDQERLQPGASPERRSWQSRLTSWRPPGGLLAIYLVCLAALLCSSALLTYISSRNHLAAVLIGQQQIAQALAVAAAEISTDALYNGAPLGDPELRALEKLSTQANVVRLEIVDSGGRLLYSAPSNRRGVVSVSHNQREALETRKPTQQVWQFTNEVEDGQGLGESVYPLREVFDYRHQHVTEVWAPILNSAGGPKAAVQVLVNLDTVKPRVLRVMGYSAVAIFGTGLLLSVLLGFLLAMFVHWPLRQLQQATQRVAAGDRNAHIRAGRSDEFGRLARSFNDMAARIDESTTLLEKRVAERTADLNTANAALNRALAEAQERYEAERHRARQLNGLAQTARLLSSSLDQPEALQGALANLCRHLGATIAVIVLGEKRSRSIRIFVTHGAEPARLTERGLWTSAGPAAWIIGHKQTLRSDDVIHDERFVVSTPEGRQEIGALPASSYLGTPLVVEDRVLGALEVIDDRGHAFSSEDVSFLEAQAGHIAAALSNASLFAQTRKRAARLHVLNEIGRRLAATLQLEELYPIVHAQCRRVLAVDAFYIALYDPADEQLTFPYCYDGGMVDMGEWRLGKGPTSHVIRTRQPYLVNSPDDPVQKQGRNFGNVERDSGSAIHVPLLVSNRVIGALSVQTYGERAYDQEDVAVLVTIASQTAVAMENVRLYTEVQTSERQQRFLAEATHYFNAARSVVDAAQRVAERCVEMLGDACVVELFGGAEDQAQVVSFHRDPARQAAFSVWSRHWLQAHPALPNETTASSAAEDEPRTILLPAEPETPAEGSAPEEPHMSGGLSMPMRRQGKSIGRVVCWATQPDGLPKETGLALADEFARRAALAIWNAQLLEQVQRSEQHLVEMVAATPDTVVVGDVDRNIVMINAAAEHMLGYQPEILIGRPLNLLFPPESIEDARAMLRQLQAHGLVRDWETYTLARNGEHIPVSISLGALRGSDGSFEGLIAIARDLRERRRLEQQLVQAERLSAVGGLVAGVAHELNNPLTTVLGFSELLSRAALPAGAARDVQHIHQAAERCKRIVADLLSFARAPKTARVPEDLNKLVERVLALMGYAMRSAGVEVDVSLDASLNFVVLDAHQIQQVLFNLLQNALQALEHQAPPRRVEVSTVRQDSVVVLRVADNGPGIVPEHLNRLFEPFFSTKEVGQGTGLGLALVYSAVREHGGTIRANNLPGGGAEFIVELPDVVESAPVESAPAHDEAPDFVAGRKRVLVVDDEAPVRKLLDATLGEWGFTVDTAADGVAALRQIERHALGYDVVLADVRMPGLGGAELYQHIADRAPDLARRVIFITGDTVSPETRAFLEGTNLPAVAKPFSAADIKAAIARTIEGAEKPVSSEQAL
jgi:PAS domain S-box-containing protein